MGIFVKLQTLRKKIGQSTIFGDVLGILEVNKVPKLGWDFTRVHLNSPRFFKNLGVGHYSKVGYYTRQYGNTILSGHYYSYLVLKKLWVISQTLFESFNMFVHLQVTDWVSIMVPAGHQAL